MPLSHAIGFYGVFLITLVFNGTYFVVSDFNPPKIVDLIERERITYAFCVPTMFQAMVASPNYTPAKMASMELALLMVMSSVDLVLVLSKPLINTVMISPVTFQDQ